MEQSLTEPSPLTSSADLFGGYSPSPKAFDELVGSDGKVRPHWTLLVENLNRIGSSALNRHWEQAQRHIRESGIAFHFPDAGGDRFHPWELDPLPMIISSEEWRSLSGALVQRAELLNRVLADIYGPQTMLAEGLLPPELIYGNPGFWLPLHGQRLPDGCFLHLYAADLARAPDGKWWVVADRTEAPSGIGYAVENRIAVSQMLPTIIHDCQVERLAPFFIALRETLERIAPHHKENPRIVVLTQGPSSPTYFEDAYLSRYLGYTLVEGGDLTVRDDLVMLKTLGGLIPVDVIFRRVRDADSDPLELRGGSLLGIAGLLQAVRAGKVAVANALGSGMVESPAFLGFLPKLCQRILGEELKLPSLATWWCGEPEAKGFVTKNLSNLNVRPAFHRGWNDAKMETVLSPERRSELQNAILERPRMYIGQEPIVRSSAPVWNGNRTIPWYTAIRLYVVFHKGNYIAMPGGLVRVAPGVEDLNASITTGDRSKDAWILSDKPVRPVTLLKSAEQHIPLRRGGAELPSRVADNFFWLGRYIERAEVSARLLRTVLARLTGEADASSLPEMNVLLRCLAEFGQIEPGFALERIKDQLPAIEKELPAAVFNSADPMTLRATVGAIHRTAASVRDRISLDAWRLVNGMNREFHPSRPVAEMDLADLLVQINPLMIGLLAFSGLVMESMTRTQGWSFLDMGRRIERAQALVGLLRNTTSERNEDRLVPPVLEAMLEVSDSLMTYRSRYLSHLQVAPFFDLLLTDETNPRAVAFQLAAITTHVNQLPRDRSQPLLTSEQRLAMSLLNSVRMLDVEQLGQTSRELDRNQLDNLLGHLATQLPRLSNLITHRYLIHSGPPRQLADLVPR